MRENNELFLIRLNQKRGREQGERGSPRPNTPHAHLAGEEHGRGHLLHGQVPDAGGQRAPAGGAEAQLLPALLADQVPGLALQDGRQHIVEAHGALEQRGQLVMLRGHRPARPREDGGGGHRGGTGAGRGDGGGGGSGRSGGRGGGVRRRLLAAGFASAGPGGGRAAHGAARPPPSGRGPRDPTRPLGTRR